MNRPDNHQELKKMLSAYLDGELTQAEEQRVRLHLEDCQECRRELEQMAELQKLTAAIRFQEPPDSFLDSVEQRLSVRAPRRAGWGLILGGIAAWVVYLVVLFLRAPRWPTWPELFSGAVVTGFVVLFVSVLRQRLLERPRDRYRKVIR